MVFLHFAWLMFISFYLIDHVPGQFPEVLKVEIAKDLVAERGGGEDLVAVIEIDEKEKGGSNHCQNSTILLIRLFSMW